RLLVVHVAVPSGPLFLGGHGRLPGVERVEVSPAEPVAAGDRERPSMERLHVADRIEVDVQTRGPADQGQVDGADHERRGEKDQGAFERDGQSAGSGGGLRSHRPRRSTTTPARTSTLVESPLMKTWCIPILLVTSTAALAASP